MKERKRASGKYKDGEAITTSYVHERGAFRVSAPDVFEVLLMRITLYNFHFISPKMALKTNCLMLVTFKPPHSRDRCSQGVLKLRLCCFCIIAQRSVIPPTHCVSFQSGAVVPLDRFGRTRLLKSQENYVGKRAFCCLASSLTLSRAN